MAPMKAPDHPVPSGDRTMARLLLAALAHAGHEASVLSTARSFLPAPHPARADALAAAAVLEIDRLAAAWGDPARRPEAVLAYHLHYKAPDLIGLPLARRFGLPYLTAEASYARKRDDGPWADRQALVVESVRAAAVNLCFTANDRAGLASVAAAGSLVDFPPFIDLAGIPPTPREKPGARELVTVAMMRPGDKLASYAFLATALHALAAHPWRLTIVGDGPARAEVERLFAGFAPGRLRWRGMLDAGAIATALREADLLVWPGFNEAFGLCYLEAAACGLPAVAVRGEGTPSVVRDGETGTLTEPEFATYAAAVLRLLDDDVIRRSYGAAARRFVEADRSLPWATRRLDAALHLARRRHREAGFG